MEDSGGMGERGERGRERGRRSLSDKLGDGKRPGVRNLHAEHQKSCFEFQQETFLCTHSENERSKM